MIIFGHSSSELGGQIDDAALCDHCGHIGLEFHFHSRHAHVYWIPLFPLPISGVSYCPHCQAVHEPSQMNPEVKERYHRTKTKFRTPIWKWVGTAIALTLILVVIALGQVDDANTAEWVNAPQNGDIWVIEDGEGKSAILVHHVKADGIIVRQCEYAVESGPVEKLIREKGFGDEREIVDRGLPKTLYADGILTKVIR